MEFFKELLANVNRRFEKKGRAELITIVGNNGCLKKAIVVKGDGEELFPAVHVNVIAEEYKQGIITVDEATEYVLQVYEENKGKRLENRSFLEYSEKTKGLIRLKLVDYKRNKERLIEKDIPYVDIVGTGLAAVFYVPVLEEERVNHVYGTVEITTDIIERVWGVKVSSEELFSIAKENMEVSEEPEVLFMSELCQGLLTEVEDLVDLLIVRNHCGVFGAGMILLEETRKKIRERVQVDKVFVLPSSVHETIMLRYNAGEADGLRKIVREVNRTQVSENEILSDEVFLLNLVTGEFTICEE